MHGQGILIAAIGTVPVLLVVLALRPVSVRERRALAARYSMPRRTCAPELTQAIARSRGMRLLGAAVGFSLPALIRGVSADSISTGSAVLWGAAGYLGGAFLAAALPTSRAGDPVRSAVLAPRRLGDYVSSFTLAMPGITLVLCLVGAATSFLSPRRPDEGTGNLVASLVLSLLASIVTVVASRRIVRRPQPVADPEVLVIDDAMRSHGLHLVFGTGNALGALGAAGVSFQAGIASDVQLLRWVFPWIGVVEVVLAVFVWRVRTDGWRVQPKVPV